MKVSPANMDDDGDLIIRKAKKEDLKKLVEVYSSAYRRIQKYAYKSKNKIISYLEWLYREEPEGFLVAEEKDRIIGFASFHTNRKEPFKKGKTGELQEIAVKENYQGRGVGKILFKKVLEYARRRGCKSISLWVGEENWPARSWYERMGFREKGGWGEWIRMVKKLSSPEIEEMNKDVRENF